MKNEIKIYNNEQHVVERGKKPPNNRENFPTETGSWCIVVGSSPERLTGYYYNFKYIIFCFYFFFT